MLPMSYIREFRFNIRHLGGNTHAAYSYQELSDMYSADIMWEAKRLKKLQNDIKEASKKQ